MSLCSKRAASAAISEIDGMWISENGAIRLELRARHFVETHRYNDVSYSGSFTLTGKSDIHFVDKNSGMTCTGIIFMNTIRLRDDTFCRIH